MTLVTELDLPVIDITSAELAGDGYHQRLAELREQGWLASCGALSARPHPAISSPRWRSPWAAAGPPGSPAAS